MSDWCGLFGKHIRYFILLIYVVISFLFPDLWTLVIHTWSICSKPTYYHLIYYNIKSYSIFWTNLIQLDLVLTKLADIVFSSVIHQCTNSIFHHYSPICFIKAAFWFCKQIFVHRHRHHYWFQYNLIFNQNHVNG